MLRDLNRESSELYERMHERKYRMMSTLRMLRESDLDTAQYYVQVVDYLNELTKALTHIVRPAYGHIDNNHEGLTREQTTDLIRVGDEVEAIYRRINAMLTTNDFGESTWCSRCATVFSRPFRTRSRASCGGSTPPARGVRKPVCST